jgi:hypothetical protein
MIGRDAATRPAVQEHRRFGAARADALVIQHVAIADVERAGLVGFDSGIKGARFRHVASRKALREAKCSAIVQCNAPLSFV